MSRGRRDFLQKLASAALVACGRPPIPRVQPATEAASAAGTDARVLLAADGQAKATIHVDAEVMSDTAVKTSSYIAEKAEEQRVRLRESVRDLAATLEKVTGAKLEIVTGPPLPSDGRTPILIGELGTRVFGPSKRRAPYKQGFRVVVSNQGVGLIGESALATSYAIYELLDRLGCRWFMPSDMGEVLPSLRTLSLAECDYSSAPFTHHRRSVWYADDAYRRRNRHGGLPIDVGQTMEERVSKDDRAKHPEWVGVVDGKPSPIRLKWSSATLASFVADKILESIHKDPNPSYNLTPVDGFDFDESKEDMAIDAGDFDPVAQKTSLTDRLLVFCNRVAGKVSVQAPDVLFGVLAYVQFTRPPVRERVHPSIVPILAPILYSRFHPMSDDAVPGNAVLRAAFEGWGKAARETSFYAYGYNLAEPTAPVPMLAKWSFDLPFAFAHGCRYWQPETLPSFESQMQALYMANRLAWDPTRSPAEILKEIHASFYGHAAEAMTAYWSFVDDVWVKTPEYSGCGFGYQRRWSPARLAQARGLLRVANGACRTPMETRRVLLADESMALFEGFMQMRFDLADGRFAGLPAQVATWRKTVVDLANKYKDQYCFSRAWAPETVGARFFSQFFQPTYEDAARIAADVLLPRPVRRFRWKADPEARGESLGWAAPAFEDREWAETDVCEQTWSSLGLHDYYKSVWYRAELGKVASPPAKSYLWVAATDGTAKVFVNGRHVPFVDGKGGSRDELKGFCVPGSFDVSGVLRAGDNHVAILCTRPVLNELGTGGLLGPVTLYGGANVSPATRNEG